MAQHLNSRPASRSTPPALPDLRIKMLHKASKLLERTDPYREPPHDNEARTAILRAQTQKEAFSTIGNSPLIKLNCPSSTRPWSSLHSNLYQPNSSNTQE